VHDETFQHRTRAFAPSDVLTASLLRSALTVDPSDFPLAAARDWLERVRSETLFRVLPVPLDAIEGWYFDPQRDLRHNTGKFFSVEGVEVRVQGDGRDRVWRQPVINQPEVGILGILGQVRGGVLRFLLQAKIEPGNVNGVQLSPTVQATRSNYTQVHGGNLPPYLEWFLDTGRGRIIVDQLQSEQGARFLKKRNRNIMLVAPEEASISALPNFCWLTLGQIKRFLREDNLVNMDTRSVLACTQMNEEVAP